MVSDELVANSRASMLETLRDLSCAKRQAKYRRAVPFVHVPIELACQWDQHSALIHSQRWFRDSFEPNELNAILEFDSSFSDFRKLFGRKLPDLDVLWSDQRWANIGRAAAEVLETFE